MQTHIRPLARISACLASCASTKESILPQDSPTMQAIYATHFEALGANDPMALRQTLGVRALDEAWSSEGYLVVRCDAAIPW